MADYCFNIAKGQIIEYVNRVNANDPAASALIVVPLSASGTEAQGQDLNDLSLVLADANFTELTGNNWSRKTLTDTEITTAVTVDDTNNRNTADFDDVTWSSVTGGTCTGVLICYDSDTGAGTDANIVPLTHHDFSVTGNGGDITLQVGANGFIFAS